MDEVNHGDAMLCDKSRSRLLLIDVQEKLASAMPAETLAGVLRQSSVLVRAADALQIPIAVTEQYPQGLGPTHVDLRTVLPASASVMNKTCFSSCGAAGMDGFLGDHSHQCILLGMETHVCVLQTALELQSRGYSVFVVEDAVCSRYAAHRDNALRRLQHAGVILTNTESVLFEWLRDANHPQFKTLSKLIR